MSSDHRNSSVIWFLLSMYISHTYQLSQPPLAPQMVEVPRSTFQFDFDFEKKILAEAEKGSQNWSRIAAETPSTKTGASTSSAVHISFAAFFTIK